MIKNLHFTRSLAFAALAIFILLPGLGWGQTLYTEDFGSSLTVTLPYVFGTNPTGSASKNADLTSPSWNQTQLSANATGNPTGCMSSTVASSVTITATTTLTASKTLSTTNLSFDYRSSGTGPTTVNITLSGTTGTSGSITAVTLTRDATFHTVSASAISAANLTGTITITITASGSGGGTFRFDNFILNGSIASATPTITTAQSGNWSSTSTWVGGVVPAVTDNVIIANTHSVTVDGAITRNSGTTTTVNSGGTLAASATLTNNGTITVNGAFQLNASGWATGTNFVYGAASTLIFNTTYTANNGAYWPASSGPVNVSVNPGCPLTLGFARTVTGVYATSASTTNTGNLTINGTCQINTTAATFDAAINYGAASTLVYNVNATMGRGNEWNNSPANITLQNNSVLNYPNGWGAIVRTLTGNITIGSGSALYMDYGSPGTGVGLLTVGGNVANAGSISLGNLAGGDLAVGGNWTNSGTFAPNGRAVFFNGTANQTITNASGETFNYLINNKASGALTLVNDVTVNASSGDGIQILNAGTIDLNGKILTLSNTGGNLLVSGGARSVTSTVAGGTLNITGNKTITQSSGSLTFGPNVIVSLSAGLNFGSSLTTLNGTLKINTGGYVDTNPPIYGSASTLLYNGVSSYAIANGWTGNATTAGSGTPQNVTLTSSSVIMPASTRSLAGNLTIGAGSTLDLSSTFGADLNIGGNWSNSGTFNCNSRLVQFRGAAAQTLTGATSFDYLTINNSSTGLTLNDAVTVNQTLALAAGKITLGANILTVAATGTITGHGTANYIVTNSTGQLKRTVGGSAVIFPVGNSTYNPITFNNTGGTSDVYGVRVLDGAITTGAFNTKTVDRSWVTTEAVAGGSNLSVVAQYNTGEPNTGFTAATDPFIGFYNGSTWTQAAATVAGANPYTFTSNANISPSDLTAGTQYFALGKDNAFLSVATNFVITTITPTSPTAGSGFSVTVRSQDAYGAFSNVAANTSFTLSTNGIAGSIGGTVTGTITAGSSTTTVSGVTLASAGTLVTLTATRTSGDNLTAGTSSTFTVLAAADHLTFVGVPATGNVGVNLTSFTVEARRPDGSVDNTYTGSIVISKASGSGILSGTLTMPATAGIATFSAAQFDAASTYTLSANSGSLTAATSGSIVVTLLPVSIFANPITGTNPSTSNPYTIGQSFNSNIIVSGIGRGSGIAAAIANDRYSASGWDSPSINLADYFEFTLTPNAGYYIDFSDFVYTGQASGTGPTSFAFRSSLDAFTANIGTPAVNGSTISLTSATYDIIAAAITFRIYGYGASAGTGTYSINDFIFNGNVICVQPVAYAVTGGGPYCSGGTGVAVGLSNSQVGVSYQLKLDGTNTGSPVAGTGSAISFGNQTAAGSYTVVGSNTNGTCNYTLGMTGSVTVTLNTTPTSVVSGGGTVCNGGTLPDVSIALTGTGPWNLTYTDGTTPTPITNISTSPYVITAATAGTYTVTDLTDANCTALAGDKTGSAAVTVNPRPASVVSGGGTICSGSTLPDVSIALTGTGPWDLTYTDGITPTSVPGNSTNPYVITGATAGTYTVTALSDANCTALAGDMTGSATVTVNPQPTSVVSGGGTVCNGGTLPNVSIALTGTGPWNLTYTDGTTPTSVTGNSTNPYFITGATAGTYTVTALTDANCTALAGDMTGSATVTVNPRPTSVVSGGGTICSGSTLPNVSIALTGTGPWDLTYTDGTTPTSVPGNSTNPYVITGATAGTYTVTALTDANCTALAGDMTGSATVTVNPQPTSVVSGGGTVCSGGTLPDVSIALTGTGPWDLTYTDGTTPTSVPGNSTNPYVISGATAGTYTVTDLTDANCTALAGDMTGSATVNVNALPTATLSGNATICAGSSTNLSVALTGTQPWSVTYFDGTSTNVVSGITTSPATILVSPASTVTYTLTAVSDATCTGTSYSGSAVVTVTSISAAPTGNATQSFCNSGTVAGLIAVGTDIKWYDAPTDGTLLTTGTALADNTHYFASQTVSGLCESATRLNVLVLLIAGPTANAGPDGASSTNQTYLLSGASATNYSSYSWSTDGTVSSFTGTNSLTPSYATGTTSGVVTFTLTVIGNAGCGSAISAPRKLFITDPQTPLTWKGQFNDDWGYYGNWDPAGVPGDITNVTIPVVASNYFYPTVKSPSVCNNITVNAGASLIDNGLLSLSANAIITVEHTAVAAGSWHFISSPVADQKSSLFNNHYLRSFTPGGGYVPILNSTTPLTPMQGFALWPDGSAFTAPYSGKLNKETSYNFAISGAGAVGSLNERWNLVGNPYPSSIDWRLIVKTDVEGAVYVRNGSSWSSYTSGVGVPGTFGPEIAPTQGFFVRAKTASGGTLTFTNIIRVHHNTTLYKNADAAVPNLVRLKVSGNGYSDEAVVRFLSGTTTEFDSEFDAVKLYGDVAAAAQLYTLGSQPLAINALPHIDDVSVGIKTGTNGTYTIAATELNDLGYVTLEDTQTGIFTDLSANSYTFDALAGTFDQRFKLHFRFLSVDEAKKVSAIIYSYQQTVHINLKDQVKGDIYIYNISGQLVATKLAAQGMNEIKLPIAGNYIVKVISKNNIVVRKVFILQ